MGARKELSLLMGAAVCDVFQKVCPNTTVVE
jgi:hypothetical protein